MTLSFELFVAAFGLMAFRFCESTLVKEPFFVKDLFL